MGVIINHARWERWYLAFKMNSTGGDYLYYNYSCVIRAGHGRSLQSLYYHYFIKCSYTEFICDKAANGTFVFL